MIDVLESIKRKKEQKLSILPMFSRQSDFMSYKEKDVDFFFGKISRVPIQNFKIANLPMNTSK